jgi:uncharacterized protein (DUF1330 family)
VEGGNVSAYIVVNITVNDPALYDEYKLMAPPSIAAYGGRYLVRGGATSRLEGEWTPNRFVILEFPSTEQARAWWDSPEYRSTGRRRQNGRPPRSPT